MKVQKLYEQALAIVGKTEDGTAYSFMDRVPPLLNPDIMILNNFRDDDEQLDMATKINDELELTNKEAQGLSLCLAYHIVMESENIPDAQKVSIQQQRNQVMGSICSGMDEIRESIDVSGVIK